MLLSPSQNVDPETLFLLTFFLYHPLSQLLPIPINIMGKGLPCHSPTSQLCMGIRSPSLCMRWGRVKAPWGMREEKSCFPCGSSVPWKEKKKIVQKHQCKITKSRFNIEQTCSSESDIDMSSQETSIVINCRTWWRKWFHCNAIAVRILLMISQQRCR